MIKTEKVSDWIGKTVLYRVSHDGGNIQWREGIIESINFLFNQINYNLSVPTDSIVNIRNNEIYSTKKHIWSGFVIDRVNFYEDCFDKNNIYDMLEV